MRNQPKINPSRPRSQSLLVLQSGQSLVLGVLMLTMVATSFVATFQTKRLMQDKGRQQHVTDATAHSIALSAARGLNMQSYINRANIAHQVAMAHLVTLASWIHFAAMQSVQSKGYTPVFLIKMIFGNQHSNPYNKSSKARGKDDMADESQELATAFAQHDEATHKILSVVSQEINQRMPQMVHSVAQELLEYNYPKLTVNAHPAPLSEQNITWQLTLENWDGFSTSYKPDASYRSFLTGITDLYGFLKPRNHTVDSNKTVDAKCVHKNNQLRRKGHTELDDKGQWSSIDTQALHELRHNKTIGCYYREYQMGWGWIPSQGNSTTVEHSQNPPANFSKTTFWRWVRENTNWDIHQGKNNPLTNSFSYVSRKQWKNRGLTNYYDIAPENNSLIFKLTTSQIRNGYRLNASARAHSVFYDNNDNNAGMNKSAPSLWQPRWQTRLIKD